MAASYDKGTLVRITATFTNAAGTGVVPTTVTCTVKDPNGVTTTPTVVNDSGGVYHADVDTTGGTAGQWSYLFKGTGSNQGADEDTFTLNASQFG